MKWLLLAIAVSGLAVVGFMPRQTELETVLVIGGDTHGYLSPCGCTKPMSGGIRRRIAMMKQLAFNRRAVLVENGGLVSGSGPQDQLKARTIAESLSAAGFDAVHLGLSESKLGVGGFVSLCNILGDRAVTLSTAPTARFSVTPIIERENFAIGGLDANAAAMARELGVPVRPAVEAVDELAEVGASANRVPVLLFQGSLDEAKKVPGIENLGVVVYRSTAAPSESPIRFGRTLFVSPGEKGKHVVSLTFVNGKLKRYDVFPLTPDVVDDPATNKFFGKYLQDVDAAGLLDKLPRTGAVKYIGTKKCGSCHSAAMKTWKSSAHAGALATLEREKHARDPDCVGCHVVGLSKIGGFRSRSKTPQLADVGCESCHGSGAKHAVQPAKFKMGKVGAKSCAPCHVPNHSPGFDFKLYWPKIKH